MPSKRDYEIAAREQAARERGRTIPHYTRKVVKRLAQPATPSASTPSKRAPRKSD